MKWKCLRCEITFDDSNKKCDCTSSPSPWVPVIEIQFEKVEIKSGGRKLEGTWTFELEQDIVCDWDEDMFLDDVINFKDR